jgi:hypothetical protein
MLTGFVIGLFRSLPACMNRWFLGGTLHPTRDIACVAGDRPDCPDSREMAAVESKSFQKAGSRVPSCTLLQIRGL